MSEMTPTAEQVLKLIRQMHQSHRPVEAILNDFEEIQQDLEARIDSLEEDLDNEQGG